jgi:hypothetical protein
MSELPRDLLVSSWTGRLTRLPKPDSESDTSSSDDEPVQVRVPVSNFAQGNRRADPVGKRLYYPSGDLPSRWIDRREAETEGAHTTLTLAH